jgi:hypothetical protein
MVDDIVAEARVHQPLGHRHADGIGETLAKRAGRRLDARGVAVFRMAGGARAELAEAPELVDRHVLVAEQEEQRIKQHRAVPGGQHEAVAVRPCWVGGIELQMLCEQQGGDVCGPHRQAGMAGIGRLHGVHGKDANRIGHQRVLDCVRHRRSFVRALARQVARKAPAVAPPGFAAGAISACPFESILRDFGWKAIVVSQAAAAASSIA